MDLDRVADELLERLDAAIGIRRHKGPPDSVTVPAAVLSLPERIEFDQTYGRGEDRVSWPLVVLVSRVTDRLVLSTLAAYCAGSGAKSVKEALEGGTYQSFDGVQVPSAETDVVNVAGTDYAAVLFELEIVGPGEG